MKRAALYMRVSSTKQVKEGDSIHAQKDALYRYVKEKGMSVAGEYLNDGVSGTRADRDELSRLLEDVQAGKIDIILCTKLDRLYRNIKHYLNMMEVLDRCGVGWLAIWEPIYDTTTPQGRLIVNQMMSIAQFEASQTAQTAQILAGQSAEIDGVYNRLKNCPVPSMPVYGNTPIFTCQNNGSGCGNNF